MSFAQVQTQGSPTMTKKPRRLQQRLAKYGLAAGAVSSVASGDVVLIDTSIPIPSGTTQINFADGLLNFDVTFVNSSFSTQFMSSMGSECCAFSNYYTTYGSFGGSFCVSYAFNSSGQFVRSEFFSADCASNVTRLDTGTVGDDVAANIADCDVFGTLCVSSSSHYSSCAGSDSTSFSNCGEARRFYVGFETDICGRRIFGWMQIDNQGETGLQISRWAYEDSGLPIEFGELPPPQPPACDPDLNGDGIVDAADMGILLSKWGPCDPGLAPTGTARKASRPGNAPFTTTRIEPSR